ncbi:beta-1,3-glucan-binding protein-like [Mya arenaria]|uniref:beta-1,3-glucan-binding protein-like n=1 Tax=Mya arenaria TaxID=6604 RepID=UPI0022E8F3B3|nr:beta-1,3-glucan-binding protein-like [Mya arenaria]
MLHVISVMLHVMPFLIASSLAASFPEPRIKHLKSHDVIEIAVEDVPGMEWKNVQYVIDETPMAGVFFKSAEGIWKHHKAYQGSLQRQTIHYQMVGEQNGDPVVAAGTIETEEERGLALVPLAQPRRTKHLVLWDDFNFLNRNNWDYEVSMYGGYNWEVQVYTNDPRNVFTRNGHLFLKPTLTSDKFGENFLHTGTMDVKKIWGYCTNADRWGCIRHGKDGLLPPVMSGKLKSKKTVTFGEVCVRARIPQGDWIWPAIWMLPRYSKYGGWPRSGEIDLMESRGNSKASDGGHDHGRNQIGSTMHWGTDPGHNRFMLTHGDRDDHTFSSQMHTYCVDWTHEYIAISVDNHQVMRTGGNFWQKGGFRGHNIWANGGYMAPFDQPFYLILNVAIAGTNGFFPDNWTYNSRKPWGNNSPTEYADFWRGRKDWLRSWEGDKVAMEIDWVKMYQY